MSEKKDKISQIERILNLSSAELARQIGVSPQTVTNWKKRGIKGEAFRKIILTSPSLDPSSLTNPDTPVRILPPPPPPKKGVPYYNVEFTGSFIEMVNDQTISPEYYIDCFPNIKADTWCKISGDSMSPLIQNGDMIALQNVSDLSSILYGEIYAIVTKELRTVKRVKKSEEGEDHLLLVPENKEEYEPQDIHKAAILQIYKVVGCMKMF